ncbi:PEGA domain-containing protein [Thermococcus henrietii]|uniref:PEGA domain-containing protein n=1 Tax=Thermococcus henrietii TaxID=2016361 RepID=UPI001314441F|nr:PEGA domain-containing protein [Thermococcus henrietii]
MEKVKRLLLISLLILGVLPGVTASNQTPNYGVLTVTGSVEKVSIPGVGVFQTPVTLILPAGNYTVLAEGKVELEARVFLNSSKHIIIEFHDTEASKLVNGNTTILGVKVTYDQWKNYPKLNGTPSLGLIGGCGGSWSPFYYTDKPLPLTLEDVWDDVAKLEINGTVIPCYLRGTREDISGKLEYIFYEIIGSFGTSGLALKNASFITPLSEVSVSSDLKYVQGYVFNVSASSMVVPFKLILPVIPRDVYNVRGVSEEGDVITIKHIPKIDTYNLSVGINHTLLTAVIKLAPHERYSIHYNLKPAVDLIQVTEEPVELYKLTITTKPEGARFVITNGSLRVEGTSPASLYLPWGKYTITAFANGSGAVESFSVPGTGRLNLTLKPLPARLTFNVSPENASVFVNGRFVENDSVELPPGEYVINVTAAGYVPKSVNVVLAPNESKTLTVTLKHLPVLFITTKPTGASVTVGNRTCESPCRVVLFPGKYLVRASLKGYENGTAVVYLEDGDVKNVSITLEPIVERAGNVSTSTSVMTATLVPGSQGRTETSSWGAEAGSARGDSVLPKVLALAGVVAVVSIVLKRR